MARAAAAMLCGCALLTGAAIAATAMVIPWPAGAQPQLDELVADALELAQLERFEEFLEASEKGEDAEHFFVLQDAIDRGEYSVDELFLWGDALFGHEFRGSDGYAATASAAVGSRVHNGPRGGLDTFSCAGCHSVGGPDGAGSATQNAYLFGDGKDLNSALVRNPPALLGLGFVQALAAQMSQDLAAQRRDAREQAVRTQQRVSVPLRSSGVSFGVLSVDPDASVDTRAVTGVNADLVVLPFGWKGKFVDLRRAIEDAARVHFGIQSHVLTVAHKTTPVPELLGAGVRWWDPDGDGRARELEEGSLTASAVYLAMLESPTILPPFTPHLRGRWAQGSRLFDQVGCDTCHRRSLTLRDASWEEHPDTTGGPAIIVHLLKDGEGPKSGSSVKLFSDLRRHAMGDELRDPHSNTGTGIPADQWLTRPLWGLAETAPYLHDGRAPTIVAAILAHGGEAAQSRAAFAELTASQQADLHIFLLSLTRQPKVRVAL